MWYVGNIGNAGLDMGEGSKAAVLPPGFERKVLDGYHVFRSKTYNVCFIMRGFLVNGDTGPVVASFKKHLCVSIYPLAQADKAPAMEFKNISGKFHNIIHANTTLIFNFS